MESLLEWWQQYNPLPRSRLILVLDSDHSYQWLRTVRRIRDDHVAVQTCRLLTPDDPESTPRPRIGDFTSDWMNYSSGSTAATTVVSWKDSQRLVRALYAVSRHWTDFVFHRPTDDDIVQHWDVNFPKVTKPLIMVTNFPKSDAIFCCCDCLIRCVKRTKMAWFPSAEYDTGHGFKLVRS